MKKDNAANRILRDFMENASQDEIHELERLLKERESRRRYSVPDPAEMARKLSEQIHRQMGLTGLNIKSMARDLVIKLAKEHKPDITPAELKALVEQMVPSGSNSSAPRQPAVPPAMMKAMIEHFIAYSRGEMKPSELESLPHDWVQKYWDAFPRSVRKLLSVYIKGGIDTGTFWKRISEVLRI